MIENDEATIVALSSAQACVGEASSRTISIVLALSATGLAAIVANEDVELVKQIAKALPVQSVPAPMFQLRTKITPETASSAGFVHSAQSLIVVVNGTISHQRVHLHQASALLPGRDRWLKALSPMEEGSSYEESRLRGIPAVKNSWWRPQISVEPVMPDRAPELVGGTSLLAHTDQRMAELKTAWGRAVPTTRLAWPMYLNPQRDLALCAISNRVFLVNGFQLLPA